jgi:hypothetical protein
MICNNYLLGFGEYKEKDGKIISQSKGKKAEKEAIDFDSNCSKSLAKMIVRNYMNSKIEKHQ